MTIARAEALALIGATLLLPDCAGGNPNVVRVGSKNFTEAFVIAEIYAQALERSGLAVERHMDLGSTQIAMAALRRGDIDLYPEYTGTALIDVLHLPLERDPGRLYRTVAQAYRLRFDLVWLRPAPMNDSQGLATTHAVSRTYRMTTLSQLALEAPHLRLAAIPEFLSRPDALPGLQRFYGGFHFKSIRTYDIGLKYEALLHQDADVATAFTTDGEIAADHLVLLVDDKHFWPAYNVAPVVRAGALHRNPRIAPVLNRVSPFITSNEARRMNYAVDFEKRDPSAVASAFLRAHAL
ncbi:MAG: ABC transporter substrate-binding protein [Vulcanimicrobiaceae bacterium]